MDLRIRAAFYLIHSTGSIICEVNVLDELDTQTDAAQTHASVISKVAVLVSSYGVGY